MIRMIQSTSAGHAKSYFSDALSKADYYLNDQELQGRFNGLLAERLGVSGPASRDAFFALCENKNPLTGEPLTPRMKEKRIVGYDINFHCPKSLSILHALSKDDHLLKAFEACVLETMQDIQKDAKTRVRKDGVYEDRDTGELIWADFTHQTARPVGNQLPDPHLHAHCFVFNATFDKQENKIKAAKFRDIMRDMPYYQALFHKRLADKMVELGYRVKATDKSFEIEGVPQVIIDYFSKRTNQIGQVAKEKGITDRKELDALGAKTRSKKQTGLSMYDLKNAWRYQIQTLTTEMKLDSDRPVRYPKTEKAEKEIIHPDQCIDYALSHCFELASVMDERRVLATAYRFALGQKDVSIDALTQQFKKDNRIIRLEQNGRSSCTTKEVLSEEKRMVDLARGCLDKMTPLYAIPPHISNDLDEKQRAAVSGLLTSRHQVNIIRGVAGSGKTTLMKEATRLINDTNKRITVVAPTAKASRGVLKDEGFKDATTVAKLLIDKNLQDGLKGQVLWVDEAGLLGTRDMLNILTLVKEKTARLILGGDTRQHASVVRGDALRILNTIGGIKAAEINRIHRQKNREYRKAVEHLSKGQVADAFNKLDAMDAIRTVDPLKPNDELVTQYIHTIHMGESALVISPTHEQGERVTEDIRQRMKDTGIIGKQEFEAIRYINMNFTDAQKTDWRNYQEGHVIQFNQNHHKIKRGSSWTVISTKENNITIKSDEGKTETLPSYKKGKFDVYRKNMIGLSKGDKIRITKNGFDKRKKRLDNGDMLDVMRVTKTGRIILRNRKSKSEYILGKEFGHLAHGYCTTSHVSQGTTVDKVLISQPSSTFGATNAKQFYVSVSRGRHFAMIFTDDREALLEAASEIGDRQSAIELTKQKHIDYVLQRQRTDPSPDRRLIKQPNQQRTTIKHDYEPK